MFNQLYQLINGGEALFHFGAYSEQATCIERATSLTHMYPEKYPQENWVFSSQQLTAQSNRRNTIESLLLERTQHALEPVLKVIFRKYIGKRMENTGPIALFPELCESCDGGYLCGSYMHIGQHKAADYDCVISQTRPATPQEYSDLKSELEGAPYYYKLEVRSQRTPQMRETFLAQRSRILGQ